MSSKRGPTSTQVLINEGLVHPQGLAVDQKRRKLLVADPDSKRIFSYSLQSSPNGLVVGPQSVCAEGIEARWVTIDSTGNIFFSDEPRNQIMKITSAKALRGDSTPEVVYDGALLSQVSAPGGIATDNFHTYWVNKQIGSQVGSLVQASADVRHASAVRPLARNTDKSYGVCLALGNVFFTQPDTTISGVKKDGSSVVTVSNHLTKPRGCVWDGDGTVYVADRGANAVYSFAANMPELGFAQVSKAVDFQDAFGVAVFSGSLEGRPATATWLGATLLTLLAAAA